MKTYTAIRERIDKFIMERIDDLQCKGYRIIQDSEAFCYGTDAVLLANFAKPGVKRGRVFDLCTGNGIVPLLLAAKTEAESIYGIEIQREAVELARRSVALNEEETHPYPGGRPLQNPRAKDGGGEKPGLFLYSSDRKSSLYAGRPAKSAGKEKYRKT